MFGGSKSDPLVRGRRTIIAMVRRFPFREAGRRQAEVR